MPRARKEYPDYNPSHTQMHPGAYSYYRGRGQGNPNHHNYNGYCPPNFYDNQSRSMPHGQEHRHDGSWNSHQTYSNFNNQPYRREDRRPRRNEHTYRASYFPNTVLRTVHPSSFESRCKQLPNTRNCTESQVNFTHKKTDLQPLVEITPGSQSKLDLNTLDIQSMADQKLKIKSDFCPTFGVKPSNPDSNIKSDQDMNTTESHNLVNVEIRRVDLQPNNTDPMLKADPKKIIDMTRAKLQLDLETTESQVNFKVQVDITAPKSRDKMDIAPADSLHNFENKLEGLINSEKRPLLDYIDLTDDGSEAIKLTTQPQPSSNATILMATSNLHLQLPSSQSTEDQNEKPLLTANAAIVQVSARGHDLEYAETSDDDYSPPPAKSPATYEKVTSSKKPVQKKTVAEDVDMRIGRMPNEATHLRMLEKSSTKGASLEKSSQSCLEDIQKEKKLVSPIVKSKSKDPQLCSTMLASISSAFACKSKESKIGDSIPSAKESRKSIDAPPPSRAAAVVCQEETICKEIAVHKKDDGKKSLPAASSVVKSKHDRASKRKISSDTEKSREKHLKKATEANEKRRSSSSSIPDTADSIQHRCSPLPEKDSLGKQKENSGKGLNNISGGTKLGNVVKDDGITSTMNKSTLVAAHCSSQGKRSNSPSPDDVPVDRASLSSESSNKHISSKNYVDKIKVQLMDSLVPKVKTSKDSRASEEKSKSRKHLSSRKSSSDSERAGDKSSSSSSSEKREKQMKSYQKSTSVRATCKTDEVSRIETDSNHELVQKSSTKYKKHLSKRKQIDDQSQQLKKKLKTSTLQPDLDPSAIYSKKVDDKTSRSQKGSELPTLDDKCKNSKKISSAETGRNRKLEDNISKPAKKSRKRPEAAIYKMTLQEWEKMGKPSVDNFKETKKQGLPSPLPVVEVPDEKIPAIDATAVDLERFEEQFNVCHTHISDLTQPGPSETPKSKTYNNTDLTPNNNEEIDDKSTIVRFEGNVINISEAHLPVITIRDNEDVLRTASTDGILTLTEYSGVNLIKIPNSDVNMFNFKEEKELMIDDSNFLSEYGVKEEINIDGNSESNYFPVEEVVEIKAPLASTGLLWTSQANGLNEFPGKVELTKLVEYFILLNQDLIKFHDSYRIASRLDETLRRVDERRATSDLLLVIKKVKPLIEELVDLIKVVLKPDGDLPELIYNYKEILPSDALKLKADTLSRKAIADIFRLIYDGSMDDIGFYQSSTVIVYNKEQGLNSVNFMPNIKPESMSQSYQSVIRNLSLEPIEQNVIAQCVVCCQKAAIPCGYCKDVNVCSKSHLEEHCTNFHSMVKSYC